MTTEDIMEPLVKTIGVLWAECKQKGETKEALQHFESQLRTLRIFVGNTSATYAGVAITNHIQSVKQMIAELSGR